MTTTLVLTPADLQALGLAAESGAVIRLTKAQLKRVLGARLEAALERRGLSQADLARRLKTTRSVVSRWCDGTNLIPTLRLLEIAFALETERDELLPDVERPAAPPGAA